jgi:hypothetical protein
LFRNFRVVDIKDKVTVWAGVLTIAVLQIQDRVDTQLNLYYSDWTGVAETVVGYISPVEIAQSAVEWRRSCKLDAPWTGLIQGVQLRQGSQGHRKSSIAVVIRCVT